MGTIAKLVAETSVDPTGLRTGLRGAAVEIERFANTTRATIANMPPPIPPVLPPSWRNNARMAGNSLAREMAAGFGEGNAIANMRRAMMGAEAEAGGGHGFLGTGLHVSPRHAFGIGVGVFSLLGGLSNVEQEKDHLAKVGKSIEEIVRALTLSLAVSLDPTHGAIVAIVGGGIAALVGHFSQLRSETAKAAREFEDSINKMIDAADSMQMQRKIQMLEMGRPSAGTSSLVPTVFGGGITDIQAQIEQQRARLKNLNFANAKAITQDVEENIARLEEQLRPLLFERARLTAAILNPLSPREIRGAQPINVKAAAPATAAEQFTELVASTQRLMTLQKTLNSLHIVQDGLTGQLVDKYRALERSLAGMSKKWSEQAVQVKGLIAQLEDSDIIRALAGLSVPLPKPGLTPDASQRGPTTPYDLTAPATGQEIGLHAQIDAALGPFVDKLNGVVGPALSSFADALGPATLLLMAVQPALDLLGKLLEEFVAPITAVAEVMVQSLEPALRALYPIVRSAAWVIALFSEMTSRVVSALARVVGNVILAVGEVIKKISLGFAGKGLIRAGKSIIDFADQTSKSADAMGAARKKLGGMDFGQTADDITGLGDAARMTAETLRAIPEIWKVNLARWRAALPIEPTPLPPPTSGTPATPIGPGDGTTIFARAGSGGLYIAGDVHVNADDPETFWRKMEQAASTQASRTTGRPVSWQRVFG